MSPIIFSYLLQQKGAPIFRIKRQLFLEKETKLSLPIWIPRLLFSRSFLASSWKTKLFNILGVNQEEETLVEKFASGRGFWIVFVAFWSSEDSNSSARSGGLRGTLFRFLDFRSLPSQKKPLFFVKFSKFSSKFESENELIGNFFEFLNLSNPRPEKPLVFNTKVKTSLTVLHDAFFRYFFPLPAFSQ